MEKDKGLPLNEMLKKFNIIMRNDSNNFPEIINNYDLLIKQFINNSRQGINAPDEIINLIDTGTILIDSVSIFNEFLCKYMIFEISSPENYLDLSDAQKMKNLEHLNKAVERYNKIRRIISKS